MKVIATNVVTDIEATSEDANYLASNLLDEHPKRLWKANNSTVDSATLTVSVNGKSSGMGMFGITADSASVTISDPNGVEWETGIEWETGTEWDTTEADLNIEVTWITGTSNKSMWVDFDQFDAVVDISVTLYTEAGSAETIAAGVVMVGEVQRFSDPAYGLAMQPRSFSIKRDLSNGSFYGKKRDVVKAYSGQLFADRDTAFWDFMDTASANDITPMAWQIGDSLGHRGAVYARFENQPQGSYTHPNLNAIGFTLIEVL